MDHNHKSRRYDVSPALQPSLVNYTTLWIKFTKPEYIALVGRDTLCLSNGCQILFHHLISRTEQIINANSEQNGDGVSCLGGHKVHPLLAYAEQRDHPRVFLVRTQDLRFAPTLRCNFTELSVLTFSDSELLFGLSGYPECSLVAWKWKTEEIMSEMSTGMFYNRNVVLKTGFSTQPIYVAQLITQTSEMKMWEAACCGKKCVLKSENVTFDAEDPRLIIGQIQWSADGNCFALDTKGNVFKYDFEAHVMKCMIPAFEGDVSASFAWWKNGLLIQGADQILRHYSKDTNYELNWAAAEPTKHEFTKMFTTQSRDHLVVQTATWDLLLYEANTHTYPLLRSDEACITHFGLVPPQHEHIVTLGMRTNLSLWEAATGQLVHSLTLQVPATHMVANRTYPYVALCKETGRLNLYAVLKRPSMQLSLLCQFNLTRTPLQEAKFFEQSRIIAAVCKEQGEVFIIDGIPGGKFKVLAGIMHDAQIVDYIVVGARSCLKLFLIPETSGKCLAGNIIVRYCVIRHQAPVMKVYDLENAEKMYTGLYVVKNQANRDRMLYATPFDNKNLHELELKRGDTHARIVNRYKSQHMMRGIQYTLDPNYILSHGYDGIVILRDPNFDVKKVLVPHHRFNGGVLGSAYDPHNHRVFTLGRDGLLMCNELPGATITSKAQAVLYAKSEELADMFKTSTIGFNPKGIYEGVSWLEYKNLMKIEAERLQYQAQRKKIVDTFNSIKKKAVVLLNHNLEGPKNERLELQDFNLDLQRKEDLTRASMYQCEKLKIYLDRYIQDQDRISAMIKEKCWDTIDEPTKNLWAIFGNFDVQSYAVLPPDMNEAERLERIVGYREIEDICAKDDSFKPWTNLTDLQKATMPTAVPKLSTEKPLEIARFSLDDDDDIMSESYIKDKEDEFETYVAFFGSSVPLYMKLVDVQYEQAEVQTFLQQEWTYSISVDHQQQLRDYFNQEFEQTVQLKVKELGSIIERNARLRYIIAEMNYFSLEQYDINPIDPYWKQDETPELITKVDNSEVGILPYISPSEQAFLDAKAAEEERVRLLLLADDFKERALMKMMNGVLEVRWEDELRRELPKPRCMLEKLPENYNEEDIRQVRDYKEQVTFMNSERNRYKTILTAEYTKVGNQLREGVRRFNDKVKDLLVKKIQIDGALTNEQLRMHRLRVRGATRTEANQAEKAAEEEIVTNEKKTDEMGALISSLNSFDSDLKANLEMLLLKDRIVEKSFKREFQEYSAPQFEILTKLYKKRPRVNFKVITSACSVQEMAKMVASNDHSIILFGEPLEFLKGLDLMDKYFGIPPIVDEALFNNLVRVRRLKIESELKVRACQMEIAEAEATQQMYHSHHSKCKEQGIQLLLNLDQIRNQKVTDMLNLELQLVLKQAYVELPRTGSMSDFADAILVNRKDVEDINAVIQATGAFKIKAMRNALQFRKEIMIKEWQHTKKKMEIADLEHELVDIESIKLTKEMQQFLKMRSSGVQEKTIAFEHELELLKERYQRQIGQRTSEVDDLSLKLETLTLENNRLNKEIQRVNIDVCEANLQVDDTLDERERRFTDMRIQANLKRSRLVNQIQVNHNQILVLQAELELCRLRTVPILDYKVEE